MKFCELCDGEEYSDFPGEAGNENWSCPLLGKKNICNTCCQIELEGGLGKPEMLKEFINRTGKTAEEINATCVGCVHGGKKLNRVRK